jgi:hypothetical protein
MLWDFAVFALFLRDRDVHTDRGKHLCMHWKMERFSYLFLSCGIVGRHLTALWYDARSG